MIFAKYLLRSFNNKNLALNFCRSLQTTQVLLLRVTVCKLRRKGTRGSTSPLLQPRQIKDSEFINVNDEYGEDDNNLSPNFLKEAYDTQMRELKDETKKINKIIMKKSFAKRAKEPNMLTFNEREHIRFLHKSDPVEWSPEQLSESFPALPWAIRRILENKWIPENEEKIKKMDEVVLQNWEKLKQNKLEASKELLEHLKKFIDKRENLEIQLKNPNFFHLPKIKNELTWKSGNLNSFLLKYEKEVNKLRENAANVTLLTENCEGNENAATTYSVETIEKGVELVNDNEIVRDRFDRGNQVLEEGIKINVKSGKGKREKEITLQQLKKNIFEKFDKQKYVISPLEEKIIHKTLMSERDTSQVHHNSRQHQISPTENAPKRFDTLSPNSSVRDLPPVEMYNSSATVESPRGGEGEIGRRRMKRMRRTLSDEKEENSHEDNDISEVYPNIFTMNELGSKLFCVEHEERETEAEAVSAREDDKENAHMPCANVTENKRKKSVNYFNTEKDKEIYEDSKKLLSETIFWNSRKKNRSLDSGFDAVSSGTASSPHIASHIQTYFTYDYPLKIEIPNDKREKGKLYKMKDCYYDDNGTFLYRVPGMSEYK